MSTSERRSKFFEKDIEIDMDDRFGFLKANNTLQCKNTIKVSLIYFIQCVLYFNNTFRKENVFLLAMASLKRWQIPYFNLSLLVDLKHATIPC